jgi:predicted RNase H-like HicB family nuclease
MNRAKPKKKAQPPTAKAFKIIIEKHPDGYVAYPLGLKGVVVGEGNTYEEAMADVKSAIRFHRETFGKEVLEVDSPVLEAFVAETEIAT